MKTLLAIGLVLLGGGIFLWITEPAAWIAVVLVVIGLSPFTLWMASKDTF